MATEVDQQRPSASPIAVIAPAGSRPFLALREAWATRGLLLFLAWRDVKVRYTQAALGSAWALLQPALMMVIFTFFLGRIVKVPSGELPYPLFVLSGLVPWTFFANAVGSSSESLVTSANLITKVYFSRVALPIGSAVAWLPDLLLASFLLGIMMLIYGVAPPATILLLPIMGAFALLAVASVSIPLSALNVRYRDVRHALPFLLQVWLFATPVVYPATLVPERWHFLLGLNPMTGVVAGFRWAALGTGDAPWVLMLESLAVTLGLLSIGLVYFHHAEDRFADVI